MIVVEAASRYLVNNIEVTPADPRFQDLLAVAYSKGVKPRCLCTANGVEMYIAKYKDFVIKRMPETAQQHHPICLSYDPPLGQSGLGEFLGEAIIERNADLVEIRLDFPLTRRLGRAITPGEPAEKTEIAAPKRRLGLHGLVHCLWEKSNLNRWYPRMEGKRSWSVVRKHLINAAQGMETKGTRLAERLLIPEPFRLEDINEIVKRRTQTMAILLSPSEDVQFKMMVVLGELKVFTQTDIDYRIVLKHMSDCPLFMEKKAGEQFKRVFAYEYETWVHQRSTDQQRKGSNELPDFRFVFAGLIYAKRENVFHVDTATVMMTTGNWIPVDYTYEAALADALTQQGRKYLKPLRYESKHGASFPNFILLDTGDKTTTLDIVSPFMSDKERGAKELAVKGRAAPSWVWRIGESAVPPVLPSVGAPAWNSKSVSASSSPVIET